MSSTSHRIGRDRRAVVPSALIASPAALASLHSWWHADLGVTLDPTYVSAWADQSGNGNDLVQGTAGNRPLLTTMTSGEDAVYFDPARFDFLDVAAVTTLGDVRPALTYFALIEMGDPTGWRELMQLESSGRWVMRIQNNSRWAMNIGNIGTGAIANVATVEVSGNVVRIIGTYSGGASGTSYAYRQLTESATGSGTAVALGSTTPLCRVGGHDGTLFTCDMLVRTLGIYTRVLTAGEIAQLDAYLASQE